MMMRPLTTTTPAIREASRTTPSAEGGRRKSNGGREKSNGGGVIQRLVAEAVYEGKPTLLSLLNSKPTSEKNAKLHEIVQEIGEGDEKAGGELLTLLFSNVLVPMLVMLPGSAFPQLAHSLMRYSSRTRGEDENHGDYLIFVGDRTKRGDPTAFVVVDADDGDAPGDVFEVNIHESENDIEEFIRDSTNDGKLLSQTTSDDTYTIKILKWLPLNDPFAKFVAKENPTMFDIYTFVNTSTKLTDVETEQAITWLSAAVISNDKENKKKKSSILALNLLAVTSPSEELGRCLASRLDVTIGRAPQGSPSNREDGPGNARIQRRIDELDAKIKETADAKKLAADNKGWSDGCWARMCGYCGVNNRDKCPKLLHDLEECDNKEDAMALIKAALTTAADDNYLRVTNAVFTEGQVALLMKGQLIPSGADMPMEANISKTFSHMRCPTWTSDQRNEYESHVRAAQLSTNTRTYGEARLHDEKEIQGKLARPPPASYQESRQVYEDFLIQCIAFLGQHSALTKRTGTCTGSSTASSPKGTRSPRRRG